MSKYLSLMFLCLFAACQPAKTATDVHKSVSLPSIYFTDNSSQITDQETISQNAKWLIKHPGVVMILAGYCDERGSHDYNLSLGARRSQAVMASLIAEGVKPEQLIVLSYGKSKNSGNDLPKNRRVDFIVR